MQCPFHGWQWNHEGRNVCIPYQDRPNRGRRIRTYSDRRAQRIRVHLARRRAGANRFSMRLTFSRVSPTAAAPPTTTRSSGSTARLWNCIRSTSWKTASTSRISSSCTRRRSCRCSPVTTSTIRCPTSTSPSPSKATTNQTIDDVKSGVEAINGGLGIAVTKSWGMVDNRTISAITPVDECTSDVRFMVYIGRKPGDDSPNGRGQGTRVRAGSHPAVHTGCPHLAAPTLFRSARTGQRRAEGLHRNSQVGHAVLSRRSRRERRRAASRIRERSNRMSPTQQPIRVFQVATGNVGSEMIKRIATRPDLELIGRALLLAGEDRQGRRRAGRVGAERSEGDRFDRGDHRGQARCADLPRGVPRRGPVRQSP